MNKVKFSFLITFLTLAPFLAVLTYIETFKDQSTNTIELRKTSNKCKNGFCENQYLMNVKKEYVVLNNIFMSHELQFANETVHPINIDFQNDREFMWSRTYNYKLIPGSYILKTKKPERAKRKTFSGMMPLESDEKGLFGINGYSKIFTFIDSLAVIFSVLSCIFIIYFAKVIDLKMKDVYTTTIFIGAIIISFFMGIHLFDELFPLFLRKHLIRISAVTVSFSTMCIYVKNIKNLFPLFLSIVCLYVLPSEITILPNLFYIHFVSFTLATIYILKSENKILSLLLFPYFYNVVGVVGISFKNYPHVDFYMYSCSLLYVFSLYKKYESNIDNLLFRLKQKANEPTQLREIKRFNIIHGAFQSIDYFKLLGYMKTLSLFLSAKRVTLLLDYGGKKKTLIFDNGSLDIFDDNAVKGEILTKSYFLGKSYFFQEKVSDKYETDTFISYPIVVNNKTVGVIAATNFFNFNDSDFYKSEVEIKIEHVISYLSKFFLNDSIYKVSRYDDYVFSFNRIDEKLNDIKTFNCYINKILGEKKVSNEDCIIIVKNKLEGKTEYLSSLNKLTKEYLDHPLNLDINKNQYGPVLISMYDKKDVLLDGLDSICEKFHPKTVEILNKNNVKSIITKYLKIGDKDAVLVCFIKDISKDIFEYEDRLNALTKYINSNYVTKKMSFTLGSFLPQKSILKIINSEDTYEVDHGYLIMLDLKNSTKISKQISADKWLESIVRYIDEFKEICHRYNVNFVSFEWDCFLFSLSSKEILSFACLKDFINECNLLVTKIYKNECLVLVGMFDNQDQYCRFCISYGDISRDVYEMGTSKKWGVVGNTMAQVSKLESKCKPYTKNGRFVFVTDGIFFEINLIDIKETATWDSNKKIFCVVMDQNSQQLDEAS